MAPIRLDLTARLCDALGLFAADDVEVHLPGVASDEVLHPSTTPSSSGRPARLVRPDADRPRPGLGTEDVPTFVGMHESSARIVAGSLEMAQAVWRGEIAHGVNFCGGLHHAMSGKASGFCVYNDIAVAIQWLLDAGVERVAYIDIDVHHGDGVEAIFWNDPRYSPRRSMRPVRRSSRAPGGPATSVAWVPRDHRSMSRCRRV